MNKNKIYRIEITDNNTPILRLDVSEKNLDKILRYLAGINRKATIIGTPKVKNWFYTLYNKGVD